MEIVLMKHVPYYSPIDPFVTHVKKTSDSALRTIAIAVILLHFL